MTGITLGLGKAPNKREDLVSENYATAGGRLSASGPLEKWRFRSKRRSHGIRHSADDLLNPSPSKYLSAVLHSRGARSVPRNAASVREIEDMARGVLSSNECWRIECEDN